MKRRKLIRYIESMGAQRCSKRKTMATELNIVANATCKAWGLGLLVRHSPGMALPDRTLIVSERS